MEDVTRFEQLLALFLRKSTYNLAIFRVFKSGYNDKLVATNRGAQ